MPVPPRAQRDSGLRLRVEHRDVLMTGAIHEAADGMRSVIHFGAPMKAEAVRVLDTWRTLGMRGTGSHDVSIDGLLVPEANVAFTRAAGAWHPVFQVIATVASAPSSGGDGGMRQATCALSPRSRLCVS